MSILEKMMGFMMNRMSKEDKEEMMDKMMEEFFADMTAEDKQKMMAAMMPKMMEGMDIKEMMPQMMMGMMGGAAKMSGQSASACGSHSMGDAPQAPMMQTMMTKMMPHCLETVLPEMPPAERREFVLRMTSILARQGSVDMSDEEKKSLVSDMNKRLQTILRRDQSAA
jgi:hypothetical protein